jgi:hypothetical protein
MSETLDSALDLQLPQVPDIEDKATYEALLAIHNAIEILTRLHDDVLGAIDDLYVNVAGDTMTGSLGIEQNLNVAGDADVAGILTHDGYYGGFHQYEEPTTIVVSVIDTYYQITGNHGHAQSGMVFASDALVIKDGAEGAYLCTWAASFSDGGNTTFELAIFVNGVQLEDGAGDAGTTGALHNGISSNTIIPLQAGDIVDLRLANHTNTNDCILQHCNLTLIWVGK